MVYICHFCFICLLMLEESLQAFVALDSQDGKAGILKDMGNAYPSSKPHPFHIGIHPCQQAPVFNPWDNGKKSNDVEKHTQCQHYHARAKR